MKTRKFVIAASVALAVAGFTRQPAALAGAAHAVHCRIAGTTFTTAMDLDGDGSDQTSVATYQGRANMSPYRGQGVSEAKPTPGTGCSLNPSSQSSCTLGSVTNACQYDYVAGFSANRDDATGDIETFKRASGSLCIDFTSGPPFKVAGTVTDNITGGTGPFAGATGSITTQVWGEILGMDPEGRGFGWYKGIGEGTISK